MTAPTSLWVELDDADRSLRGWLLDDLGAPLARRRVVVEAGGVAAAAVTGDDGGFTVVLPLSGGEQQVRATFEGSTYHEPSSIERAIDPGRAPVRLELVAPTRISLASESVEVQIRAEEGGAPARLQAAVGIAGSGRRLASARTEGDGWGYARLPTRELGPPGPVVLEARFEGTEHLAPSLARAQSTIIEPTTITLEADRRRLLPGHSVRLRGRLSSPLGPLVGETITLENEGLDLGEATTDARGEFALRIDADALPSTQDVAVTARYASPLPARLSAESAPVALHLVSLSPVAWWWLAIPAILSMLLVAVALLAGGSRTRAARPTATQRVVPAGGPVAVSRTSREILGSRPSRFDFGGRVWDPVEERPVGGAIVRVGAGEGTQEVACAADGRFGLSRLSAGRARVEVEATGYVPEIFEVAFPHRGTLADLTIHIVQVRHRILEVYRDVALPLLPRGDLFSTWTPRELARHAAGRAPLLADPLVELTSLLEQAYYSPSIAACPSLAEARRLAKDVGELARRESPNKC